MLSNKFERAFSPDIKYLTSELALTPFIELKFSFSNLKVIIANLSNAMPIKAYQEYLR